MTERPALPASERLAVPASERPGLPACPFCGSKDTEMVSPWGGQLVTSQLRCRHCNTYFEAIRHGSTDAH